MSIGPAMSAALPFLSRPAADPEVPHRDESFAPVLPVAAPSGPIDPDNPVDQPFVTHRSRVRRLLDDDTLPARAPLHDDERARPHTTAQP